MPVKDYKFLMNGESELTYEDLYNLVKDNEISNFDPVAEAFKVYDPTGAGYTDTNILKSIYTKLGFGDLSEEDIRILVETADLDGDGVIGLEDFRQMSKYKNKEELSVAEAAEGGNKPETGDEEDKREA